MGLTFSIYNAADKLNDALIENVNKVARFVVTNYIFYDLLLFFILVFIIKMNLKIYKFYAVLSVIPIR